MQLTGTGRCGRVDYSDTIICQRTAGHSTAIADVAIVLGLIAAGFIGGSDQGRSGMSRTQDAVASSRVVASLFQNVCSRTQVDMALS